jgi:pyruvate dehydrogenase E2 component (dihydrolipoamide acetyltransferase)
MAIEVVVPEVGEAGMEITFAGWLLQDGDAVEIGDALFEIDTSKATLEVEAFAAGTLSGLRVREGEVVEAGQVVAVLLADGERPEPAQAAPPADTANGDPAGADQPTEADTRRARVRAAVAAMTTRSWTTVPHFHLTLEADVTEALQRLRPTVAIARGIVASLEAHPECNLRWTSEGKLERRSGVDLGLLVDTPAGLLITAVRDAHRLDAEGLAAQLAAAGERARSGSLRPEDQGARSVSFSNLGMFAVDRFEGVIAAPDVLLLSAGRVRTGPRLRDGEWVARSLVNLTLSVDHRALDGADGARLAGTLEALLADAEALA